MGLRGPLRDPESRRGKAEVRRRQKLAESKPATPRATTVPECIPSEPSGKLPTPPKCFTREQCETFQNLVVDLLAARVPLERVDSHALAMAVRCLDAIDGAQRIANDGDANVDQKISAYRLMSSYSKDLKDWLTQIGANPGARARIGLKAERPKAAGPIAQMLAARMGRKA